MSPLKLALLTREPRCYSSRRIREAAKKRGHSVRQIDVLGCSFYLSTGNPQLTYKGRRIPEFDAVIPRIGASVSFYGSSVVRQFEQMGVFSLNSAAAIMVARDKLRSLQVLSRHHLAIAPSAFAGRRSDILPAIQQVGGTPVIIKLLQGTQGVGVILAESAKVAETIIETLQSTQQNVLVQKFVSESRGKDVRAFVVGDRVVAAMRRKAVGSEFRSNVHRGGTTESVKLDPEYERTAVRAAQIIGLRVAGVDLLEGKEGPVIMEVNSSPGLQGIETVTGVDVAGAIIAELEDQVTFGDVDLRQRLSVARSFAVAEFRVTPDMRLAHQQLRESGLRERGIIVLGIDRNSQYFPAPKGDDELLPGDLLVCYGAKLALREYLPALRRKVRRKKATKKAAPDVPEAGA